ncbi:hypothetical protein MPSEU_000186900 [Mayamaea pseudoterrestris]|nr:hypothetical protein MPSEU_000186900 [Mayamaea pseudoterrestris]
MTPYESPVLIFTCKREQYLKETLDDILKYIPTDCSMGCPVVISQDGNDPAVATVIRQAQINFLLTANIPVIHWQHSSSLRGAVNAYQALAVHYGWALRKVFGDETLASNVQVRPRRVVILEEDLHVAPDFFAYFKATAPILDNDKTLLAVSAFNDNGFHGKVKDPTRILRSDFFPGLGWMMTRRLWENELDKKWPSGYWDDWLRLAAQRQGRHVLRPEVSRTYHFGVQGGASGNQFGGLLQRIELDTEPVDWGSQDLNFLSSIEEYDGQYWSLIRGAKHVNTIAEGMEACKLTNVLVEYQDMHGFREIARHLDLMLDEKDGILRTSYKGVVETRPYGNNLLFLTPPLGELQILLQHVADH